MILQLLPSMVVVVTADMILQDQNDWTYIQIALTPLLITTVWVVTVDPGFDALGVLAIRDEVVIHVASPVIAFCPFEFDLSV